jgi:dihydrofolate synthase/folylpolyglutamate synthase
VSFPHPLAAGAEALLAPRLEQRILPGLDRMQRALDALGRPERGFRSVLILGTNGKGSTAALLEGILRSHGLRVGLYTSPHLIAVEERVRTDGATISGQRLAHLLADLESFPDLSYFEALTCAAIVEFADRAVDVAIMEAGLGGRWDASSAVDPVVALLTNVGTDHQRWLGESRTAIAAEKAAALRGSAAIVGTWDAEVEPVIRANADPRAPLSLASEWAQVKGVHGPRSGFREGTQQVVFALGGVRGEASLPLVGAHQRANLEVALAGAGALARHGFVPPLSADAVRRGIEGVSWPGRLQWVASHGHRLLLDGAHNLEAVGALAETIDSMGLPGRPHLLFSCLDDKPLEAMAALLRPRAAEVTVVPIQSPRARSVEDLAPAFPGCRRAAGVTDALQALPPDNVTLVTGSLRLVGEVFQAIGGALG